MKPRACSPGNASPNQPQPNPEGVQDPSLDSPEPLAAIEAEARGPWVVVERSVTPEEAHDAERWEVYRAWEDPQEATPAATFRHRELALLYAAGMEVGGRRSTLIVERAESGGFEVCQLDLQGKLQVVGHIRVWDEDTFPAFQNLETLLRAIEPLAQVLDAAGGSIVELVGRRLMVG